MVIDAFVNYDDKFRRRIATQVETLAMMAVDPLIIAANDQPLLGSWNGSPDFGRVVGVLSVKTEVRGHSIHTWLEWLWGWK